jgi:hypothetical protein
MRRDPRLGLLILAVGVSAALIKKSKPLSKYVGDQLVRAGEYFKVGTDAPPVIAKDPMESDHSKESRPHEDWAKSAGPLSQEAEAHQAATEMPNHSPVETTPPPPVRPEEEDPATKQNPKKSPDSPGE